MILAIDQGTTGTTCLVFDREGKIAGRAYSEFRQHFPRPGWVEHDASEIWEVTRRVASEAIGDAGIRAATSRASGSRTSGRRSSPGIPRRASRSTTPSSGRTGEPPARCDELREAGHTDLVRERTGLVIDPYFSGTKIEWLRENVEAARDAVLRHDRLLARLQAHRPPRHRLLERLADDAVRHPRLRWDPELCELLGVDGVEPAGAGALLAGLRATRDVFGGDVPVAGIAGDQQAALFGQACHRPGMAKNTYGTGSFVLLNTGTEAPEPGEGLLTTVAWGLEDGTDYALEAAVFVTGAAVQWLRDGLGIIEAAAETERLAASLDSNDDVYFVPALTGLGSPYWDPYARGAIVGITRGTGRAQLARAALEAIAYQTVDAVRAQEAAAGERLDELRADGGAVANAWLMQFQADVLGAPVIVPEISETTALGAAYLAGIATGDLGHGPGRGDVARGRPLRAARWATTSARAARALARGGRALARLGRGEAPADGE